LNQCLDSSGIYVCKSFSPRCYIIQKVRTAIRDLSLVPGLSPGRRSSSCQTSSHNAVLVT
jgi:hypothetical protein